MLLSQLKKPLPRIAELTLANEIIPDFSFIFMRRENGPDLRSLAAGHGSHRDPGFIIEAGEFESFAERAHGVLGLLGIDRTGGVAGLGGRLFRCRPAIFQGIDQPVQFIRIPGADDSHNEFFVGLGLQESLMNLSPHRTGGCGFTFAKSMVKLPQGVDRLLIAAGIGWDISAMLSFFWLPAFCHMADGSCGMEMVGRRNRFVVGRFGSGKSLTYFSNLPLYDLRIWAAG